MSLTNLHTSANYQDELHIFLKQVEGFNNGLPYFDAAGNTALVTIGIGANIDTVSKYLEYVLTELGINGVVSEIDSTKTANQLIKDTMDSVPNGSANNGDGALQDALNQVLRENFPSRFGPTSEFKLTETQAYNVLDKIVADKATKLDEWLTEYNIDVTSLKGTNEYMVLTSLFYNRETVAKKNVDGSDMRDAQGRRVPDSSSLIGPKLLAALEGNNRFQAWYEIRYNANKDGQHANRRYKEAHLFGLDYASVQTGQESVKHAKDLQRMLFIHQYDIRNYEAKYSPTEAGTQSAFQQLEFFNSENLLYQNFAMEQILQGIFVAPSYIFAGDPIQGTDKNELLLGEDGNDILIGGKGDDVIRGGAGRDLYVYNSGDGQDIIVDNPANGTLDGGDGKGAIVYDGHLAGGGIKKRGETDYKSLDNTLTYQWSGNNGDDLVITGSGGTLTVKGFSNGDLGITLKDATNITTNFGPPTRTEFLRIDHYEQVGVERRAA